MRNHEPSGSFGLQPARFHGPQRKYDNFYQSLRHLAGLSPQLAEMKYPKRYDSFDEEPMRDARAVFKDYENTIAADKGGRSATFINMIALHDATVLPTSAV